MMTHTKSLVMSMELGGATSLFFSNSSGAEPLQIPEQLIFDLKS
jgi:hypothetical protein